MSRSLADEQLDYYARGGSATTPVYTSPSTAVLAANILTGFQSSTASTAATTIITVPAGRTWVGRICVSVTAANAAANAVAAQARGVISILGAGATPAAGTIMAVEAKVGADAATGTSGNQEANFGFTDFNIIAPSGNTVAVQVTTTIAGSAGVVDSWAVGQLL